MKPSQTLVLTQSEIRSLVEMTDAIPAIETAFAAHGRGETQMPAKLYLDLPQYDGDFRAMPAYLEGSAGLKWVNAHPANPERHELPSVLALYILSDPETALPLAVMDATLLTAVRTGAAAGVASKHLARPDAKTAGFIGCGVQSHAVLSALRTVVKELGVIAADRSSEAAEDFIAELGGRVGSVEEASGCDILCTATPSRQPLIERRWVKPGTHINAIGADAPGKQELNVQLLLDAKVVLDDWEQACESGEVNVPLREGSLDRKRIHASLGEVVAGLKPGREDDDEITVFDSTGLAVQDVALARLIYERAKARGLGHKVDFFN